MAGRPGISKAKHVSALIIMASSANAARNALASLQIKPELACVPVARSESTPDILVGPTTGTVLGAAGLLVVLRHGIENVLCGRPLNDEGKLAIILGGRLLIA